MVSAWHVGGTRGSDIVSSAAEVLWMSLVRGMRGVGGICEMCMCLAQGCVGGEEGEWMRGLGLGCTNYVGTGRVLDVCLCFGCGCVGGKWVGGLDQGLEGWGGVMSVCVVSQDYLCIWQVQVSVYCAWRIPTHLRCTQCSNNRYRKSRLFCLLLPDLD